jgi:hypothetical protein
MEQKRAKGGPKRRWQTKDELKLIRQAYDANYRKCFTSKNNDYGIDAIRSFEAQFDTQRALQGTIGEVLFGSEIGNGCRWKTFGKVNE